MPFDPVTGAIIGGAIQGGLGLTGAILGQNQAEDDARRLRELQEQANRANEARYREALGRSDQGRMDTIGALNSQYGQIYNMLDTLNLNAPIQRSREQTQTNTGQARQNMISRGLYNSTLTGQAERAIADDGQRRENDIYNQFANQRIGLQQGYADRLTGALDNSTNRTVGIITGRSDNAPNGSQYAALAAQGGGNPYLTAASGLYNSINNYQPGNIDRWLTRPQNNTPYPMRV